jgi:RNA exonuclease 1
MYHHPRGRPLKPGLKWLTEKWCGRKIQTRGEGGHDPEEDARACLDLLKKKIEQGPGFGEFKTDYESIFERMGRATWRGGGGVGGNIKSAVVDHGNPGVMHGNKADTALACKTDDEVLEGLLNVIPSHQFTFGRFMALSSTLGCKFFFYTLFFPPELFFFLLHLFSLRSYADFSFFILCRGNT